jgi:16S rRNA processing protein RimM
MGRIGAPYGVKGWVRIQPYTEKAENLLAYSAWWVGREGEWRQTAVAEARVRGHALIARLEGCADREAAATLRGQSLAVPRAALPAPRAGEYYWVDLIGSRVVNGAGRELGLVTGVLATGANDVLVTGGERERLIPFIAPVVREVDLAAGVIRVEWEADY